MTTEQASIWLDVRGAAARALVSPATILREARGRRLVAYKVGLGRKLWRFRPEDVDAWITATTTPVLVGAVPHGPRRA
jgi:excisionase family DNA binding protein